MLYIINSNKLNGCVDIEINHCHKKSQAANWTKYD